MYISDLYNLLVNQSSVSETESISTISISKCKNQKDSFFIEKVTFGFLIGKTYKILYHLAGPSGVEPETAGFLSLKVKSPVLYLAELRAHADLGSYAA